MTETEDIDHWLADLADPERVSDDQSRRIFSSIHDGVRGQESLQIDELALARLHGRLRQEGYYRQQSNWTRPLAAAAVLVLTMSVGYQLMLNMPDENDSMAAIQYEEDAIAVMRKDAETSRQKKSEAKRQVAESEPRRGLAAPAPYVGNAAPERAPPAAADSAAMPAPKALMSREMPAGTQVENMNDESWERVTVVLSEIEINEARSRLLSLIESEAGLRETQIAEDQDDVGIKVEVIEDAAREQLQVLLNELQASEVHVPEGTQLLIQFQSPGASHE